MNTIISIIVIILIIIFIRYFINDYKKSSLSSIKEYINNNLDNIFITLSLLFSLFGFIRNTPCASPISVFITNLSNSGAMLVCECFQTAVFHQIAKVNELVEVACNGIIVTESSEFRIINHYDFQIRAVQQNGAMNRNQPLSIPFSDAMGQ